MSYIVRAVGASYDGGIYEHETDMRQLVPAFRTVTWCLPAMSRTTIISSLHSLSPPHFALIPHLTSLHDDNQSCFRLLGLCKHLNQIKPKHELTSVISRRKPNNMAVM